MRVLLLMLAFVVGVLVPGARCRADDTFVLQWVEKQWSLAAKLRERELPLDIGDAIVRWRRESSAATSAGPSGDAPRVVLRRLRLDALAGSPSLRERYEGGAKLPGVDLLLNRGETRVRVEGDPQERVIKWKDPGEPSAEHARAVSLIGLELRTLMLPGLDGEAEMRAVVVSREGEAYNIRLDDRKTGSMIRRVVVQIDSTLREPVVIRAEYPDGLEIVPGGYRRIGERGDGIVVAEKVTIKPRGGVATVMSLDEWTAMKPGERVDEWNDPASIDRPIEAKPPAETPTVAAPDPIASERPVSLATPTPTEKPRPATPLEHFTPVSLEDDGGVLSLIAVVVVLACLVAVGISLWRRS